MTTAACAGRFDAATFGGPSMFNAMDKTHEDAFKMPDDAKENANDKSGELILGVALVAGTVASAILVPLAIKNKL